MGRTITLMVHHPTSKPAIRSSLRRHDTLSRLPNLARGRPNPVIVSSSLLLRGLLCAALALPPLTAQVSSSSSSSPQAPVAPRRGVEAAGSAVTLETSEQMFTVAAALNTCGYDAGLSHALPVRSTIRRQIDQEVATSEGGIPARRALCAYIDAHHLNGSQNLAQFVSLALFLTPPPQLDLSFPENQMPPDALNVVNVLPLLRTFAEAVHLHSIWIEHHADYDAAVDQVHDSVTRMLLETNIYLHQPASSYDGRRFLVLLEPMLSSDAVNARIYGSDYFVVASASPKDEAAHSAGLRLDELRHIYLLYEIDPIIYARASATSRLLPILKAVQDAPIDFTYKNDIVSFTTECLIKAIEARTMDVGFPRPARPAAGKERLDPTGYNAALADYDRRAELVRRKQVVADMRSGWVLTNYFYEKLALSDRDGISLKENMGELVYGMDVPFEESRAKKIPFFPEGSPEIVGSGGTQRSRALPRVLTAMDRAELLLQRGNRAAAEDLANKELAAKPSSTEAKYVLARIDLLDGDAEKAFDLFNSITATGKADTRDNARTLAWAHVYLGRMYDSALAQPDRGKALTEYHAAAAIPGTGPDVESAAQAGLKQPFAAPRRATAPTSADDDEPLDPTGKKQKESYVPGTATGAKPQPK